MVRFMRDRHLWVRTTSNATTLHQNEGYKRLVDCGINEVQLSFDGATKEVFEAIRVGSPFERVVDNMTLINRYANASDILVTRMWSLIQRENVHQAFELYEMGKRMGFRRLTFSIGLGDWGQQEMRDRNQPHQVEEFLSDDALQRLVALGEADGIDVTFWCLRAQYVAGAKETLCPWPFVWGYVSTELKMVPCCMIGNPEVIQLGDAAKLSQTWNGPDYQAFRQAHLDGRIPDHCLNCYVGGIGEPSHDQDQPREDR
jgi:pyrroloquinoline quinone biosynthesis protein E